MWLAVSRAAHEFRQHGAALGTTDAISHLAWTQTIQEKFGVEIPFPIIEDIKMEVAGADGMVHPGAADTQAVRATFFIDPTGVLRAMVYYPMSNGRSIDEFVRLLQAMQTSDANKVATPEGWKPGDDVIVPLPKTPAAIAKRKAQGLNMVDWYSTTRKLRSKEAARPPAIRNPASIEEVVGVPKPARMNRLPVRLGHNTNDRRSEHAVARCRGIPGGRCRQCREARRCRHNLSATINRGVACRAKSKMSSGRTSEPWASMRSFSIR